MKSAAAAREAHRIGRRRWSASSACLRPTSRRSARNVFTSATRCIKCRAIPKRLPACTAGDRYIQLSYRVRLAILKHAEMLQKSNARNLAHLRKTSHVFRFVFAEKFRRDRDLHTEGGWRARPTFAPSELRCARAGTFAWLANRSSLVGKVSEGWRARQDSNLRPPA